MKETKEKAAVTGDAFSAPGYSRSRWAYIAECAFEYFVALLVADPFVTTLLKYIGLDDSTTGIIQSLISVAFLFQLCSIFVVQRITNVKKVAATVHGISQLLFMSLYLVPFMPFAKEYQTVVIFVCFLAGYFGNYLVTSVIFRWGNSYVDPGKRARYAATKEMISLLTGVIVTYVMSQVIGHYEAAGDLKTGFLFTAIVMTVVSSIDFICLLLIKNRITEPPKKEDIIPFKTVLKMLFTNKGFVSVVILTVIWQFAQYMTVGFLGTYKLGELGIDIETVQLINIAGQMGRFALSRPFGRYTDKHSYAKGISLGLTVVGISFLINIFTSPEYWWLIIPYTLLFNIAMAGIGQNLHNIIYNFVDEKLFVQASAIKNSIGGICGFVASFLGGMLVKVVQGNASAGTTAMTVFGMEIYAQQMLSLISFVGVVGAIIFTRIVLEKQKTIAK